MYPTIFFAVITSTCNIVSSSAQEELLNSLVEKSNGKIECLTEKELDKRFSNEFLKLFYFKLPVTLFILYSILYTISGLISK